MLKKIFKIIIILACLGSLAGAGALWWGYNYITRDLPRLDNISDYAPYAVSSIYSDKGELLAEAYEQRRYVVPLKEIPAYVRNAFLAAEDAAFYNHPGIDLLSIFRAFVANVRVGRMKQGGSTITQQVVKNLLLTKEKKLERKIKEAILAYRIENKLSKNDILAIYLNQIFLGSTAYGVQAAARVYFHKDVSEINLAEAAILAGLPQAPSRYSPVRNFTAARKRQKYVLKQMVKAGFITETSAKLALKEEIKVYPHRSGILKAPYYVSEVKRVLRNKWKNLDLKTDGLKIYTALDLKVYDMAVRAVQKGLREVDKRQGWRGPLSSGEYDEAEFVKKYSTELETLEAGKVYPALVTGRTGTKLSIDLGEIKESLDLSGAKWARRYLQKDDTIKWIKPSGYVKSGDVIEVSFSDEEKGRKFYLDQTPRLESALTILDPHSGKVLSVVGGYDYRRSVFNRATQGRRQPGSAFKPVVYFTAIDRFEYTPSTIVYDEPRQFKVGDEYWTPQNYDKKFLGPISLRTALQKSRNVISADIISRIGVDSVIEYARKLGIESELGRNLSLSLGSSEVTPLEIVRAYGVFAAGGVLFDSIFITKIVDRSGEIIYDYKKDQINSARRVIDEDSAFIMAHMMKGVVNWGTGYRVKVLNRPVAGKTGTSNDLMDAWFVGYTPEFACGVWSGFDTKKTIGEKETGGRVSAPIWLYFMQEFLKYKDQAKKEALTAEARAEAERIGIDFEEPEDFTPRDFTVPEGVDPFIVNRHTGFKTLESDPDSITEYFKKGTKPPIQRRQVDPSEEYLDLDL